MPPELIALGIASLVVGVAGSVDQRKQAKAGLEIQEEQLATQKAGEQTRLKESRRQQLREERVRKAQILQAAENTGVGGSSGEATAISNLASRVAGNFATQTGQGEVANRITELGVQVGKTSEAGAKAGATSQLGFQVFSTALSFSKPSGKTTTKPQAKPSVAAPSTPKVSSKPGLGRQQLLF